MFSFFKKVHTDVPDAEDANKDQCPTKMTLEERKAWRSNMLCKSIQDVFLSLGITPKMYKYRITPTDERGHYYAIMVETLRNFSTTEYTTTKKLLDIEIILKTRTFDSYGIVVDGVFWKTDETVDLFDSANSAHPHGTKNKKTIHELRDMVLSNKMDNIGGKKTFLAGGKSYDTDLSPLGPE